MRFANVLFGRLSAFGLLLAPFSVAIHHDGPGREVSQLIQDSAPQPQPLDPLCESTVNSPSDLVLDLSLKNGQAVFREGEIIALWAKFTAKVNNKYTVRISSGGPLAVGNTFCISPNRGWNPLLGFPVGAMGFGSGGLSSGQPLGLKPFAIGLEVNEWRSLPPGSYRLSIVSRQVYASASGKPVPFPSLGQNITLRSNNVEFQVVPADPQWQAAQLAAIVNTLDTPSSTYEEKKHAVHVLRFLGSEAATRELARRFWSTDQPFGWDMQLGLFASPHRATAMREMKAALDDPDHPITQAFVRTLVSLEMQSDPKLQILLYDEKNKEAWNREYQQHLAEFYRRVASHMAEAASASPPKTGEAQAITSSELLESKASLTPESRAHLWQMLIASWGSLSLRQQNDILSYYWDEVAGPEWLPLLQRIVEGDAGFKDSSNRPDRSSALFRINELSPELGRQLILQKIAGPHGDINMDVLASLPDSELPQMDEVFRAKLKRVGIDFGDFPLVERYGSARLLPDIQSAYAPFAGRWACSLQSNALRYFLRVSPDFGVKEAALALHHRGETRCYITELRELGPYIRIPKMEQIVIAALDDSSPEVVRNATLALQEYGSANAEAALWPPLSRLHQKWTDDPEHRVDPHTGLLRNQADRDRETELVEAIINGQAWFLTSERIARLKELGSPSTQRLADSFEKQLQLHEFLFGFNRWPVGQLSFRLGWYSGIGMTAFKEKLAQFPAGSRIKTTASTTYQEAHHAELAEVSAAAAAHGLVLQVEQQ